MKLAIRSAFHYATAMDTEWYYTAGGAQQGPVNQDELKALIANGQLEPNAMVWRKGLADWQKPAQVVELMGDVPAEPVGQDSSGIPGQPAPSQVAAYSVPGRAPSQGLAIAAFVCSLIALLIFCVWCASVPLGVIGIIMGHIAASKAKQSPQEFGGAGLAKAGFIIGYVAVALGILIAILSMSDAFNNEELWRQLEDAQREAIEEQAQEVDDLTLPE